MRRALVTGAVFALIVLGAWAYLGPASPAVAPAPSPTPTAVAASPTPASTPAGTVSPTPSPSATATAFGPRLTTGGITVRTAAARPSADFKYVATRESTGSMHWVVLLDLAGRRAHYVAEVEMAVPAGSEATPAVAVSASADGRAVLLAATEPAGLTQLFHIAVESGQVRLLRELDQVSVVAISPDGTRYAFTDLSQQAARHGLWVDAVAGGALRRVIASSPLSSTGPARPVAFSPSGDQLAAGLSFGPGDSRIAIVDTRGAEARVEGETISGATVLAGVGTLDWRGAPGGLWAWRLGRDAFGGRTAVYSFDLRASMPPPAPPGYAQRTVIYDNFDVPPDHFVLQTVDRHPDLQRFVTWEDNGFGGPGQIWVRTRQGGATKVADVGEGGPREPWWSPDGSRLYAFRGEDDSVGTVVDVLTGEVIVDYCIRNAGPGCV